MKKRTTDFFKEFVALLAAALFTLSFLTPTALADLPIPDNFVCDDAGILDDSTIADIKKVSDELYASKGIRVAVCTVKTTGESSAGEMAVSLLKEWKIGHGMILLLASEDNTYYAVQSKSISKALTNDKLRDILLSSLETKFAEGSYSAGVADTVSSITSFLNENISESFAESKGGMPTWLSVVLRIIVVIALLLIAGYIALVILEKRNAARQRAFLEERRRMVREGRTPYRPNGAYGIPSSDPRIRPNRGTRNGVGQYARPVQPSRQQPSYRQAPANRSSYQIPNRSGQINYAENPYREQMRQQRRMYDPATAATVQINTADLRAAKAAQDKYSYQDEHIRIRTKIQKR